MTAIYVICVVVSAVITARICYVGDGYVMRSLIVGAVGGAAIGLMVGYTINQIAGNH